MPSDTQLIMAQPALPKEYRPRRSTCPLHKCSGTETTWRPPKGIDPMMREFVCQSEHGKGHGFYCRVGEIESLISEKRVRNDFNI